MDPETKRIYNLNIPAVQPPDDPEVDRERERKEFINDYINIGWRVWRNIWNIPSAETV